MTDEEGLLPGLAPGATIIRLPTDKEKTSPILKSGWVLQDTSHLSFSKKENRGEGDEGPRTNKIYT